jgi:hypothetical protein
MTAHKWMIVSYAPQAGMSDLDAPLGWAFTPGEGYTLDWLRANYATQSVARYNVRQIAEDIAAQLTPHVAGGRVAVIPAI